MKTLCETQGNDDWWACKAGIPSASNFARIFQASKNKMSSSLDGYIAELLEDRKQQLPKYFTAQGRPITPDMTEAMKAMNDGLILEPLAREWYESETGATATQTGFVTTDDGRFGCSPDGLVEAAPCFCQGGEDCYKCGGRGISREGGVEIKIYDPAQHTKWCAAGVVPTQFLAQIHGSLIVTGRAWWDLVLWNQYLPGKIIRTVPNETTRELRVALEIFHGRYMAALDKGKS